MKNDMVTVGDFMDYLEWRNHNQDNIQVSVAITKPMVRFYNNGSNLFIVSRSSRIHKVSHKKHSGRPLCKIPGVSQDYKGVTLVISLVTFGLVGLQNDSTGTIQWVGIPVGEIHSVHPFFLVTRKVVIRRVNNVLTTR